MLVLTESSQPAALQHASDPIWLPLCAAHGGVYQPLGLFFGVIQGRTDGFVQRLPAHTVCCFCAFTIKLRRSVLLSVGMG